MARQKSSRFTLASIYLAAGLGVCFLVLTQFIPALSGLLDRDAEARGWPRVSLELSAWACGHRTTVGFLFVTLAAVGFILPMLVRASRYLVWIAAVMVLLLDLALAGTGWWNAVGGLLQPDGRL